MSSYWEVLVANSVDAEGVHRLIGLQLTRGLCFLDQGELFCAAGVERPQEIVLWE